MSGHNFHCNYCQKNNFTKNGIKQHLLNHHEQDVRDAYPPTENPFFGIDCLRCDGTLQDDLRCDRDGHDCINYFVGRYLHTMVEKSRYLRLEPGLDWGIVSIKRNF